MTGQQNGIAWIFCIIGVIGSMLQIFLMRFVGLAESSGTILMFAFIGLFAYGLIEINPRLRRTKLKERKA